MRSYSDCEEMRAFVIGIPRKKLPVSHCQSFPYSITRRVFLATKCAVCTLNDNVWTRGKKRCQLQRHCRAMNILGPESGNRARPYVGDHKRRPICTLHHLCLFLSWFSRQQQAEMERIVDQYSNEYPVDNYEKWRCLAKMWFFKEEKKTTGTSIHTEAKDGI